MRTAHPSHLRVYASCAMQCAWRGEIEPRSSREALATRTTKTFEPPNLRLLALNERRLGGARAASPAARAPACFGGRLYQLVSEFVVERQR